MIQWKGWSPRQRQGPEENQLDSWKPQGIQNHKGPARGNATREITTTCRNAQKCHENNRNQFIMLKQPFETIWISIWLGNYLKPIETFWNNLLKPFETVWISLFCMVRMQQRGCNSEFIQVKTCEHFVWALEHFFKNFAYVAVQLWRAKNDELEPEFISWKIWSLRVLNSKSWKT